MLKIFLSLHSVVTPSSVEGSTVGQRDGTRTASYKAYTLLPLGPSLLSRL